MILDCKSPVLIVEGYGDRGAVPRLAREVMFQREIFDFNPAPRPKSNVDVRKLRRAGELERYVEFAARDNGDSVLLVLDCEDFCPRYMSREFVQRIQKMRLTKKVGISFSDPSLRRCFCIAYKLSLLNFPSTSG